MQKVESHPRVTIDNVTFEGSIHLPEQITTQIAGRWEGRNFDIGSDWSEALQEAVSEAWQQQGYFHAKVSAETRVLNGDSTEQRVSVTVHVDEGVPYTLAEIQFTNANEFSTAEIREQFPLEDGDVFDIQKIRQGIEALTRLYSTQGYIDFTATPDIQSDNAHQLISLRMELQAGKQFRVGRVEVLGLDQKIVDTVLKIKLKPGDLFNPKFIEEFFNDNKAVLPPDASSKDDTQVKPDQLNGTVAIVFDVRGCP